MGLQRTIVNPVPWSVGMGFHQGCLVTGATRTLYCAGQTATDADGAPQHADDLPAQLRLSLANLAAVLAAADMAASDLVRLTVYTTDVDLLLRHYDVLTTWLAAAGAAPPSTLLGVNRLAVPTLLVELEGTAVA